MKATEVKYVKRFNLGNYEHEEIGVTVALDEDDSATEAIKELKELVNSTCGDCDKAKEPEAVEEQPEAEEEVVEEKPKRGRKKKEKVEEEPEEVEEEETEEEEVEEVIEEEEEPAPAKKSLKKKGSVYSRVNDAHKALFVEALNDIAPQWKKTDASKAKAKKLSMELNGQDFLDADGEVVPSFMTALKKGMK